MADTQTQVNITTIRISHDDATGSKSLVLPARTLIQDVFIRCVEDAAGDPDIDFGEIGGDTDGILDGIGQPNRSQTIGEGVDTSPEFLGRGELITQWDSNDTPHKATKYYASAITLSNTCNSAGTAGVWDIYIMWVALPSVSA